MDTKKEYKKVTRPTNKPYYVNFPAAIAEHIEVEKGEGFGLLEIKTL